MAMRCGVQQAAAGLVAMPIAPTGSDAGRMAG